MLRERFGFPIMAVEYLAAQSSMVGGGLPEMAMLGMILDKPENSPRAGGSEWARCSEVGLSSQSLTEGERPLGCDGAG